jgi:membrane protein DedA with SNARE-associated domain
MDAGGYVGVAALVALEVVFPPLPSEPVLLLGGFLAGEGRLSFPGVVAAATVGSVTGALALYWLGSLLGEERLRGLIRDYGRWAMVKERDLDKAVRWFERHGGKAVFFGRLAPVVRSLVSVPAGVARMPLGLFLLYTTLGSLLWNSVSVGLGWWLGDRWELVTGYTRYLEYAVLAALVLAVVLFVWRRAGRGAAAGLR